MANNRLYILDTETNEAFMLCKSMGEGWYTFQVETAEGWVERLDKWLQLRDVKASFGNPSQMDTTRLRLVTEYELPSDVNEGEGRAHEPHI